MILFTMKPYYKLLFLSVTLSALLAGYSFPWTAVRQISISPTPTYDPLEEPPLPPNPTEFELGRNLYWHWCMTCHGDRGQGLTDEFRAIWEPEHQNCWGRGCHAGRQGDEGFPIPTIVPALVNEAHLARFESAQGLSDFLQETHPPQSPGILKGEEYQAIALYIFVINGRSPVSTPKNHTPIPAVTATPVLSSAPVLDSFLVYAITLSAILVLGIFALSRRIHT